MIGAATVAACQKADDSKLNTRGTAPVATASGSGGSGGSGAAGSASSAAPRALGEQVTPPFDLKNPPADAQKTASGLIIKKTATTSAKDAVAPGRNDVVSINYTGWRQASGETFFTSHGRPPMPLNLATAAPGFTEGLQLIKKGEKAVLWMPPALAYKGTPQGSAETLVFEVEVIDIVPAPAIPTDVAEPPANALTTKGGLKYEVVRPGTGTERAHPYDTVTFNYSAWSADGHMFDTTEVRKRPAQIAPYREPSPLEEILTTAVAGQRIRFWATADKMSQGGRPNPTIPQGSLCYEVEVIKFEKGTEPPATPADVAKPPADAKKSPKGVLYKVLKPAGKDGPHPGPTDTVRVNYTGWTTDGKMFDSSVIGGKPAEFSLQNVIAGWTEGIPLMTVGDKFRFWIPEQLAYKGSPGRPQGMLVFDVELLEVKPKAMPDHPPPPKHP